MDDVPPPDADLSALTASLQSDARDSAVFFAVLCTTMESALPGRTLVEREHSLVRSKRIARRLTVHLGEDTFTAEMRQGELACRHVHTVIGSGGGLPYAHDVPVQEWVAALVAAIAADAEANAAATAALRSLAT